MSNESQSIEEYLAQIARELRHLPAQARADELREIEAHLRTLVQARGEDSITEALAQFGTPRKVGRDLRRAWERRQPESWINAALAFVIGCAFISIHNYFWFTFLDGGLFFFRPSFYYFYMEGFGEDARRFCAYLLIEALFSLAMGTAIGFISPKRGLVITALTFPFLILLDFSPLIVIGIGISYLSFSTFVKYAVLLSFLICGAKFGARYSRQHSGHTAKW